MKNVSEPNAQNSEIRPQAHPSGARIEKLMKNAKEAGEQQKAQTNDHDQPMKASDQPAEGARDIKTDTHRKTPGTRSQN